MPYKPSYFSFIGEKIGVSKKSLDLKLRTIVYASSRPLNDWMIKSPCLVGSFAFSDTLISFFIIGIIP